MNALAIDEKRCDRDAFAAFEQWCKSQCKKPDGWVYFISQNSSDNDIVIKIGYAKDLRARVGHYSTYCHSFFLVLAVRGDRTLEKAIHRRFFRLRLGREFFALSGELHSVIRGSNGNVRYKEFLETVVDLLVGDAE